tara:strand:+ start:2147 stop:2623 length:477 start_codon:yes stop_codon:yes gene_type:complete
MPQPEGQPKYNDLIDIIIQSSQKTIDVQQKDGTVTKEQIIDDETIWWKTGSVNANTFGRFAYELKEWERTALLSNNNMSEPRATQIGHEIMEIGISYRRSMDAKSSESQRNAQNSQSTLIDKINKNKVERVYTMKDQAKKSLFDGFLGREREKDEEYD